MFATELEGSAMPKVEPGGVVTSEAEQGEGMMPSVAKVVMSKAGQRGWV